MEDLVGVFKQKKISKKLVYGLSVINNYNHKFIKEQNIDFYRFDLEEFALLNNLKSYNNVSTDHFLPLVREYRFDKLFCCDLPVDAVYTGNQISFEKILTLYNLLKIDFFVIKDSIAITKQLKSLLSIRVPIAVEFNNRLDVQDENYLTGLFNTIKEYESNNGFLVLLNDFNDNFIKHVSSNVSLPVITNNRRSAGDGYYARFTTIYGLINSPLNYLNLGDLLCNSYEDFVVGR